MTKTKDSTAGQSLGLRSFEAILATIMVTMGGCNVVVGEPLTFIGHVQIMLGALILSDQLASRGNLRFYTPIALMLVGVGFGLATRWQLCALYAIPGLTEILRRWRSRSAPRSMSA